MTLADSLDLVLRQANQLAVAREGRTGQEWESDACGPRQL